MARTTKPEKRKKTIPYNFGDKHKAYIRKSQDCMINVAEGAVRGINHVAMYIGDGKVVHASTERTGIKTSPWNYRTPVKIVNVLG